MCGIAGFTHRSWDPGPRRIGEATRCIHHRGPDQSGTYESHLVSMGAVRLKIIDLGGGDQPMRTEDGAHVIVFNGEVYNHAEVRAELESLGVRFRSQCDTEVVLRAYAQWGRDSFSRLRGMFAFAIWNEPERRLILVRDRLGIKPLYLHRHGEDLFFGSELKTLFAHPEVERRIDPVGLNLFLSLNYIPGPHTMVQGIEKLPPGHWLEWHDGRITQHSYWQLQFDRRPMNIRAAKEELDGLLKLSVKEHLVSDVPLGVWSSGGVDSSTIVHYAAEAAGRRLKTFSVSFQGRSFDESPWFREIAAKYGTDHSEFDLNPEVQMHDVIQEMSYFSDEPSSDAGAVPVWFLSKMTRQHVTVALSGEGADELFGGYQTYLADRYARSLRLAPSPLRKAGLAMAGLLPVSDEKISFEYKVKRMLEGSLLPPNEAHFFWNGTWSATQRRFLLRPEAFRSLELPGGDPLYVDQLNYLPDDILYKTDRMSMAHSLEVRPPFLDHRIVEFAAGLPDEFKVRGSKLKWILRELMRDKLPQSVLTRSKQGFDIPTHHWFRTILKPLLMETVTREAVEETGIFHWPAVHRAIADHLDRRANYGYHLWGLLTWFLWRKRWKVGGL
ncbi:MAG TPA: asparagine synthase (glutamine-hydrolyzing) [Bryobacteraceae bacterium]|nr:asparagine synthase (glutamine-hydrolyzing) [Bryobacteraceae bacterium]